MQITRNTLAERMVFTGTVYVDTVVTPSDPSRLGAASVHFAPGARTAWHTHPNGQTLSTSPRASTSRSAAAGRSS
jgi:quercetin dioxygenase-like cupin family protein